MSVGNYIVGVVLGVVSVGAIVVGARSLRRALLADVSGPPAWVADGVLTVALLVLALELVGVVGLFGRAGSVVACLAVATRFSWMAAFWGEAGAAADFVGPETMVRAFARPASALFPGGASCAEAVEVTTVSPSCSGAERMTPGRTSPAPPRVSVPV